MVNYNSEKNIFISMRQSQQEMATVMMPCHKVHTSVKFQLDQIYESGSNLTYIRIDPKIQTYELTLISETK